MKNSMMQGAKTWFSVLLFSTLIATGFTAKTAIATPLATDLQALVSEAGALNTQLGSINLTAENMCSELLSAHVAADALISNIDAVSAALSAPISIDADSLQALDDLSLSFVSLAGASSGLSVDLGTLNATTDMLAISNGMTAMLRLSDDIGIMADRILEMADKILLMADNIGVMADRIIITQQIQSDNLALTQASILQTQLNALALVSVVNTNTYDADFSAQTLYGNFVAADITATLLTPFTMANQFANMLSDVDGLLTQVKTTHQALVDAAADNTLYIDSNSLAELVDMSIMASAVAIAVQGQALAAEALSPTTGDITLSDSMGSILQLSSDIGVMANRILEMADLILAMADNIGLTADQIIATQQLQSTNYATTLASVEATQGIAVSVIAANSL